MKQRFETLEQANIFIDKVNILLGYPNEANGTQTYSVPELVEIKDEDGNVTDSWYEVPITEELNRLSNPELYETVIEEVIGDSL